MFEKSIVTQDVLDTGKKIKLKNKNPKIVRENQINVNLGMRKKLINYTIKINKTKRRISLALVCCRVMENYGI